MENIVRYVCPVHKNIVLFIENNEVLKYMVMERPQTCSQCKKAYYKSECNQRYGGVDDEDER